MKNKKYIKKLFSTRRLLGVGGRPHRSATGFEKYYKTNMKSVKYYLNFYVAIIHTTDEISSGLRLFLEGNFIGLFVSVQSRV